MVKTGDTVTHKGKERKVLEVQHDLEPSHSVAYLEGVKGPVLLLDLEVA